MLSGVKPLVCLALDAKYPCIASERTQFLPHGPIYLCDRVGPRDQGELELQRDPHGERDRPQDVAQRVMRIAVLFARLEQCPADFPLGAKNPEVLVHFGQLARAARGEQQYHEAAPVADTPAACRLNLRLRIAV